MALIDHAEKFYAGQPSCVFAGGGILNHSPIFGKSRRCTSYGKKGCLRKASTFRNWPELESAARTAIHFLGEINVGNLARCNGITQGNNPT